MGEKYKEIKMLSDLGLPTPWVILIRNEAEWHRRIIEYLKKMNGDVFTMRTDLPEGRCVSCPRSIGATYDDVRTLSLEWVREGYEVLLCEYVGAENVIKSGNVWFRTDDIILEVWTGNVWDGDGDVNWQVKVKYPITVFMDYNNKVMDIRNHKSTHVLVSSEFIQLQRYLKRMPFKNKIVSFSITHTGKFWFWEARPTSEFK